MTKERALAQMRALTATQALATLVGWQSDPATRLLLRSPFSEWFYAATPDLLLVPSIEPSRGDLRTVDRGMREARCDALVVKASCEGRRTLYIAYGQWGRQENVWCHGRRLWLSPRGEAWLVPDPHGSEDPHLSMQLTERRLQVASHPPARDDQEAIDGLDRADAFLAQIWGIR